jgi:uncharacterized protein YdeI (YjbR/CyaY-like superfamily)
MEEIDFEEDTSLIQSFLSQYSQLKNTGTPCKVIEARKWYATVANEAQKNLNKALGYYFINMQQKLPHSKLGEDDLETIIDDGNCISEHITIFNTTIQVVHELYKNPNKYLAWKGEIEKEISGVKEKIIDTAFYFEPKPERNENPEGLYI